MGLSTPLTSIFLALAAISSTGWALSSPTSSGRVVDILRKASVVNPTSGERCDNGVFSTLDDEQASQKKLSLVVLLPQLGEFDSSEFVEQLVAASDALVDNGIDLRVVGIGDAHCAKRFSAFSKLPLDCLVVDPDATIHKQLNLNAGPGWDVPDFISDDALKFLLGTLPGGPPKDPQMLRPAGKAWLNYLAMCAGIGAPGTLPEILRGYFGDTSAPERFAEDDVVEAGFVTIGPGVGPVILGPLQYKQWWADERGYQRPVELATIRLKNMVEVLTKWDEYVTNPTTIDQRGATYLIDNESGEVLYEYKHRGVLTYSETMARPLSFLGRYIGEDVARNPLGLPDYEPTIRRGRGILKPAGKFMSLLAPVFASENMLQANLQGADDNDFDAARIGIEKVISSNDVVIYTYGLSPFSSEAVALLEDAGCKNFKKIELGLEWFLLDKEASATRAELLAMTGQSSLPHVFIGGKHIGGLFSGPMDVFPGLAALQESGELDTLLAEAGAVTLKLEESSSKVAGEVV